MSAFFKSKNQKPFITISTYNNKRENEINSFLSEASTAPNIISSEERVIQSTIHSRFSAYTSQGKRKASRLDPIRTLEDINRVKEYFLTNGRTERIRLRNHALFVLGISIGLRPDDLLHLHFYDVLTSSGTIVKELPVGESKTNKMNRPIVNEEARNALSAYIDSFKSFNYSDYIFYPQGNPKKPMEVNTLYELMVKVSKELNLDGHIGAYTLRKTFAYWTIKLHPNDMNVMISLQEMLNHDSTQTTLHYSGICSDELSTMYNDIGNVFNPNYSAPVANKPSNEIKCLVSSLLEQIYAEE